MNGNMNQVYTNPLASHNGTVTQATTQQPNPFAEYEWMVDYDMDAFDAEAIKEIENEAEFEKDCEENLGDELDAIYYWDANKGCNNGQPSGKNQSGSHQQQESQDGHEHRSFPHTTTHHVSSTYQYSPQQTNSNMCQDQQVKQAHTFNPLKAQDAFNSTREPSQQQGVTANVEGLMNGMNLNQFHLNPNAATFIPSWNKK